MNDNLFQLLRVLDTTPKSLLQVCVDAGMKSSTEAAERLYLMKRLGWVAVDKDGYTVTKRGSEILLAERASRGEMLLTTPMSEERKAASQPKQEPGRSATLWTPALSVWVDRWGNPCVRRIPIRKVVNLKAELDEAHRKEFMEKLRQDPILGANAQ